MNEEQLKDVSKLTGIPSQELDVGKTLTPPFTDPKLLQALTDKVLENKKSKDEIALKRDIETTRDRTIGVANAAKLPMDAQAPDMEARAPDSFVQYVSALQQSLYDTHQIAPAAKKESAQHSTGQEPTPPQNRGDWHPIQHQIT
jgi:hypothetical protein